MKFKKGDTVKIHCGIETDYTPQMLYYHGCIGTVLTKISPSYYMVEIDGVELGWHQESLTDFKPTTDDRHRIE